LAALQNAEEDMWRELCVMFDSGGMSTGRDKIYHAMEGNGEEFS